MSALTSHLDKLSTEVISAIINVGQEVEEDWPLYLRNVTVIHSKKILLSNPVPLSSVEEMEN